MSIIRAESLAKRFGDLVAVEDVTLEVEAGTIFGFIGPSGAGKTTTIRMLTGAYKPSEGEAMVLDERPHEFTLATKSRIGYLPQLSVLYPDLTIWENLSFAASIYGMGVGRRRALERILELVELEEHRDTRLADASGGQQRRLALASTLVHDPELLFLDEPTGGVDPVLRKKFWDRFRELQERGRTMFVTTQYVGEAQYCDLVGFVDQNRLVTVDTPDGLRRRAFGGDLVEIQFARAIPEGLISELESLARVHSVRRLDGRSLRLIVDEAAHEVTALIDHLRSKGVEFESIEERVPSFDDVFLELAGDR